MRRENEFRYTKLAGILREQIMSGYIKPGQFLLSESELCRRYAMSRTSVRKSLEELLKEGLIVKKVGQGTIVSPDLVIEESGNKVLRILASSPSHFMDICMPMIIEEFQKSRPNVEVKCLSLSAVDFWDSIRSGHELGLQADIIICGDRQYNEIAESGPFLDLTDSMGDQIPAMYPALWNTFGANRPWKAVPVTFSSVFMVYNPELFNKHDVPRPAASWTKEDFLRAAQRLTLDTDADGIVDQYGLLLSPSLNRWPVFALQNGISFQNDVSRDSLVKTLTFLHDLLYRYRVATLSLRQQINPEAFIRQKAAMTLTTSIELSGWPLDKLEFEPQVLPMPFGEHNATLLIANVMMVPATCRDEELAMSFLRFALHPDIQQKIGRIRRFLSVLEPVNETIWDRSTLESFNILPEQLEQSSFLHEHFSDLNLMEEIEAEMTLFWSGMESAPRVAERILQMVRAAGDKQQ